MTDYNTSKIEDILQRIENKLNSLQKQIDELTPNVSSDSTWMTIKKTSRIYTIPPFGITNQAVGKK